MIRKHSHVKIGRYHQVQARVEGWESAGLHGTQSRDPSPACFSWTLERAWVECGVTQQAAPQGSLRNGALAAPGRALFPTAFARAAGPGPLAFGVHDEVLPGDQGEGGNEEDHRALRPHREAAGQWRGACEGSPGSEGLAGWSGLAILATQVWELSPKSPLILAPERACFLSIALGCHAVEHLGLSVRGSGTARQSLTCPCPQMLRSRAKELKPRRQDSGLRSGVGSTGSPRCLRVYVLRAYRFGLGNGKGFWLPDASLSGLREQWLCHHLAL